MIQVKMHGKVGSPSSQTVKTVNRTVESEISTRVLQCFISENHFKHSVAHLVAYSFRNTTWYGPPLQYVLKAVGQFSTS